MPLRLSGFALLSLLLLPGSFGFAQQSQPPGPLPTTYTLRQHVREVLTDVTVTDANGNPVTGLPASAFHIYDNGHLQKDVSFAAHSGNDYATVASQTAPGVYSNNFLAHPPAVYNIALIDITTMGIADQLILREQLDRFVQHLPQGEPLAVYMRNGPAVILLQNFTTSRAKLAAAVNLAIPRIRTTGYENYTDADVLTQMAGELTQYPGRKNLIWFSGGSNLILFPDTPEDGFVDDSESPDLHHIFDALESERIALYPVDVRGLTVAIDSSTPRQHMLMSNEAEATGGHAYYNTNGIALSTRRILNNSGDFYTLTYAPDDLQRPGQWHKVLIKVDGLYHLSYRQGYFDDDQQSIQPVKPLTASDGEAVPAPDLHSNPIIFAAQILPANAAAPSMTARTSRKPPRGDRPYAVHYQLPIAAFHTAPFDAQHSLVTLGAVAVVLDSQGNIVAQYARLIKLGIGITDLHTKPHAHFNLTLPISLPRGQDDIYLAVWDTSTGRLGTLQIPLEVKKR